eukprot:gb/GECG01009129.1/.p1 GENE.gb/GECG01009129.1/~~gb/GECG01009129.1/.p1  ORF type:complete len:707 (+),score=104.32 gb/GECG01009129.1/:1-2121(+)
MGVPGSLVWSKKAVLWGSSTVLSRCSTCFPKHSIARKDLHSVHSSTSRRSDSIYTTSLLNRPKRSRRKSKQRRRQSAVHTEAASLSSAAEGYHGYLSDGDLQLKRFDYNYWIRDIALTNVGVPGFTFLAYASDDILNMRQFFLCGSVCNVAMLIMHRNLQSKAPVFWAIIFALFNGYGILKLKHERKDVALDEEAVEVYEKGFQSHGFTPRQFARILKHAEWKDYFEGESIIEESSPVSHIVYIAEGEVDLTMSGNRVAGLRRGAFVTSCAALLPRETRKRLQSVSSELLENIITVPESHDTDSECTSEGSATNEQHHSNINGHDTEKSNDSTTQASGGGDSAVESPTSGIPLNAIQKELNERYPPIGVLGEHNPEETLRNRLVLRELRARAEAVGLRVREAIMPSRSNDPHKGEVENQVETEAYASPPRVSGAHTTVDREQMKYYHDEESQHQNGSEPATSDENLLFEQKLEYGRDLAPQLAADVASTGIASVAGRDWARQVPADHVLDNTPSENASAQEDYANFTRNQDEHGTVRNTASATVASPRCRVLFIPVSAISKEVKKDSTLEKPILSLAAGETAARLLLLQASAQKVYTYRQRLKSAIQSPPYGVLSEKDKKDLKMFREQHKLTDRQHREALAMLGWNEKDLQRGYKSIDWKTTQAKYFRDASQAVMKVAEGAASAVPAFFRTSDAHRSQNVDSQEEL